MPRGARPVQHHLLRVSRASLVFGCRRRATGSRGRARHYVITRAASLVRMSLERAMARTDGQPRMRGHMAHPLAAAADLAFLGLEAVIYCVQCAQASYPPWGSTGAGRSRPRRKRRMSE